MTKFFFKERLARARKITIGLDIWTKKGLTASFLAICACYFCTEENKAKHILMRLDQIAHPHTAECIKTCIERCTEDWGIPQKKILPVITDNGSNMVAAFKTNEQAEPSSSEEVKDDDESMESDNEDCKDLKFCLVLSFVLCLSFTVICYILLFWHSCSPVTSLCLCLFRFEPIHAPSVSCFRLLPGLTQFQ